MRDKTRTSPKERAMIIIALIVLWGIAAAAVAVLNAGPVDKEARRREAYWEKYEKK